jgi:hypothetical protein
MWTLVFASVATLLAIAVDRYLYIVKPLKYPLIVTKRRVCLAISVIWLTTCCLFIGLLIHFGYVSLTLILILNFRIFDVAKKQRKRILAETALTVNISSELSAKRLIGDVHIIPCYRKLTMHFINADFKNSR